MSPSPDSHRLLIIDEIINSLTERMFGDDESIATSTTGTMTPTTVSQNSQRKSSQN